MTLLVTGATGVIGRAVVAQLVEARASVRAITREPAHAGLPRGTEVVCGDLADPARLGPVLRGVDRMFLLALPQTAHKVVALARAAGVRRIVVLSTGAVTFGMDAEFHLPVERVVEESGLEWTHIRPGEFAYNKIALWGPSIRAERRVRYPNPDRLQICPVHEQDVAAVAVRALLDDEHIEKAYTFTGPGKLTLRDQVQAIAAAIGERITFEEVTTEEALRVARAVGGRTQQTAEVMLGLVALYSGKDTSTPSAGTAAEGRALPTVAELIGQPARTFRQWAEDHLADFR
jgi:uncharacterized protein YbjT (DUF2867 family)